MIYLGKLDCEQTTSLSPLAGFNLLTKLSRQVTIEGYLPPLLFVHQLPFGLKSIEHYYIRIIKVSLKQWKLAQLGRYENVFFLNTILQQ